MKKDLPSYWNPLPPTKDELAIVRQKLEDAMHGCESVEFTDRELEIAKDYHYDDDATELQE